MINLKKEYIDRMKGYLDPFNFDKFIESFNEKVKTGFMLNKKKLMESKVDIEKLEKDWSLIKDYESEGYNYYIYDKDLLESKSIFPGKSIYHHAGLIYIQEPSSNRVLREINCKGKKILDLCAAPGGKCIQAAFSGSFDDATVIIANEIDKARKKVLTSNIERVGYYDKIKVVSFDPSIDIDKKIEKVSAGPVPSVKKVTAGPVPKFDIIIIDAPCSGEGMMRKSETARNQWSLSLIHNLSSLQKKIIDNAYPLLKEGGILSYSTCTYAKEEDEENVEYILDKYKDMELIEERKIYHFEGIGEGQFYARFKKN